MNLITSKSRTVILRLEINSYVISYHKSDLAVGLSKIEFRNRMESGIISSPERFKLIFKRQIEYSTLNQLRINQCGVDIQTLITPYTTIIITHSKFQKFEKTSKSGEHEYRVTQSEMLCAAKVNELALKKIYKGGQA